MDAIRNIDFAPSSTVPTTTDPDDDTFPPPDLGLLTDFDGEWVGSGFNVIWRPAFGTGSDHFLALNLTTEAISFNQMDGIIPNRGLLQADIPMSGLHYFQQIKDATHQKTMHMEPGIWATVPRTVAPGIPPSIVRMSSIPHGTTLLAQGTGVDTSGRPDFGQANLRPFSIGNPASATDMPDLNLALPCTTRTPSDQLVGIDQPLLDNPNTFLVRQLDGLTITRSIAIMVSSIDGSPVAGGGVRNTGFLGNSQPANAQVSSVTSVFWVLFGQDANKQPYKGIFYTQTVLLDFGGLSWPHVTVGALTPKSPNSASSGSTTPTTGGAPTGGTSSGGVAGGTQGTGSGDLPGSGQAAGTGSTPAGTQVGPGPQGGVVQPGAGASTVSGSPGTGGPVPVTGQPPVSPPPGQAPSPDNWKP